ncbi:CTP synthase [Candidatus Woesearchaeota archaeon]|nr:CTP synthase [Candidatus Woesearchaeota archaeon]
MPETKWIVVTGGVVSGLGKGTAAASIGRLIKKGRKIVPIKCDGYLNVDPGTMNPIEHGEVFVLDDGGEVDMDFGHYERFLDIDCKSSWNLTSGKIFNAVIEKERKGEYLGKTIQIFPHVVDEILQRFMRIAKDDKADVVLLEIGGTVGDIENSWFIEAARRLRRVVGQDNIMYIHLTYVPFLGSAGEPKTKPAQRDLASLRSMGLSPDVIIARSKDPLPKKIKEKLSLFCDVPADHIVSGWDIDTVYEIPLMFQREGLLSLLHEHLKLSKDTELEKWSELVTNIQHPKKEITVALCGKYTQLKDSYASVLEALVHAGAHLGVQAHVKWIETTDIEEGKDPAEALKGVDGIIVPGGFGSRGVEGKIKLITYAREHNIPFLGLCYGLQLAVIEFARQVCGLAKAHTTEIDAQAPHPVIDLLDSQRNLTKMGATMRLGAYNALLAEGSVVQKLYGALSVHERHRHRYEVSPAYHDVLVQNGLVFSGMSPDKKLVEFIELPQHRFFCATQAHPELKSRLLSPAPLFTGFVTACKELP